MGRWRVSGDGSGATTMARRSERDSAEWLFVWVFACGICGAGGAPDVGMEVDVLAGGVAGFAGVVYPDEGAGVGGLGATSRGELQGTVARADAERETLRVPRGADDIYDVSVARHAGLVSRLSEGGSPRKGHPCGGYRDCVQHRCSRGRQRFWSVIAGDWAA